MGPHTGARFGLRMKMIMQATYRQRLPLQLEALEQREMLHGGVYPEVTLQTNFRDITIELYADDAPGTVQNFLNYINDGDYTNAIFHRSRLQLRAARGRFYQ